VPARRRKCLVMSALFLDNGALIWSRDSGNEVTFLGYQPGAYIYVLDDRGDAKQVCEGGIRFGSTLTWPRSRREPSDETLLTWLAKKTGCQNVPHPRNVRPILPR
jgi:hypothetical protein